MWGTLWVIKSSFQGSLSASPGPLLLSQHLLSLHSPLFPPSILCPAWHLSPLQLVPGGASIPALSHTDLPADISTPPHSLLRTVATIYLLQTGLQDALPDLSPEGSLGLWVEWGSQPMTCPPVCAPPSTTPSAHGDPLLSNPFLLDPNNSDAPSHTSELFHPSCLPLGPTHGNTEA